MRRIGLALLLVGLGAVPAFAFDPSPLPQTCKDTLAGMKAEKAHFTDLTRTMARYRKASDTAHFCEAAREIVGLIKNQSDRLDGCVGDLGAAKGVPEAASGQMFTLRTLYQQMLTAAKDPKFDQFHCGLADQ